MMTFRTFKMLINLLRILLVEYSFWILAKEIYGQ